MRLRPESLQGRLLTLVLGIVAIGGVIGSVASYLTAEETATELLDAQLVQSAQTLQQLVERSNDQIAYEPGDIGHRYQQKLMFQVWERLDGEFQLILRSPNAPADVLPSAVDRMFSVAEWNGHHWRFYSQLDEHQDTRVIVAEDLDVRRELARRIAWHNLVPFLAGIPIVALFMIWAIRVATRPLGVLAGELEHRAASRLDPVVVPDPPLELRPVLSALGQLFHRVGSALENERRFTSDAAHELRTPLAGALAQLQVAQGSADEVERRSALENCRAGLDAMDHTVTQLLTLARVEATGDSPELETADLAEVAMTACSDADAARLQKGIRMSVKVEPDAEVQGVPKLLQVLARNLIDNAIRHTPEGGSIAVRVFQEYRRVVLEVSDSGPGVPAELHGRLGQRFQRLGRTNSDGVGLGLSIVQRIAATHGAEILFGEALPAPGLKVTVAFPARASAGQGGAAVPARSPAESPGPGPVAAAGSEPEATAHSR